VDAVVDQNATVWDLIVKEIDIFINHLDVSTVSEFKRTFLVRMEIKI